MTNSEWTKLKECDFIYKVIPSEYGNDPIILKTEVIEKTKSTLIYRNCLNRLCRMTNANLKFVFINEIDARIAAHSFIKDTIKEIRNDITEKQKQIKRLRSKIGKVIIELPQEPFTLDF